MNWKNSYLFWLVHSHFFLVQQNTCHKSSGIENGTKEPYITLDGPQTKAEKVSTQEAEEREVIPEEIEKIFVRIMRM